MFIFLRPLYNKLRFKQGLYAYEYNSSARQLGFQWLTLNSLLTGLDPQSLAGDLKALSSEMDPAEIRLIR